MLHEAPRRPAFERLPRFAESAAAAAFSCFFDRAGFGISPDPAAARCGSAHY
jgi:hypothetical protein